MVVLGLIFVVIAAAFAVGILFGNGATTPLTWYGLTLDGFSTLSVYVAGLVTMLVLVVGLWLVRRGVARAVRGRKSSSRRPAEADTVTEEEPAERA